MQPIGKKIIRRYLLSLASAACLLFTSPLAGATITNYATGFEAAEGYDNQYDLIGQNGWIGSGATNWNGVADGFITGLGRQAYVGYYLADTNQTYLSLWQPINFDPVSTNAPVVTFSTVMGIWDFSPDEGPFDDFFWSIYNTQGQRLFTVDFDNFDFQIYYALDGTNVFEYAAGPFNNNTPYALELMMNFASNTWSAAIGGQQIVSNKPITTVGAQLTLGRIAAEWKLRVPGVPGDNFMVFDDYRITAKIIPPSAPQLAVTDHQPGSNTTLRLTGQSNYGFAIESSTNLATWNPLTTNITTSGFFDFTDTGSAGMPLRFYRARWVQ